MADVKFLANIDLNDNQLLNMKLQHLSSDPTGVEGQLFYHSGSNVVKFYDGSNWISLSSATGDISGVTAGDGLTGGGSSGAVTLNVVGGTGITANANDIAIDSTVATLSGTQTLTNKTIAASQVTEISNLTAGEGAQLENIGSTTISAAQWGYLGAATGAITNTDTNTVDMGDGFVIEDGDGTEVTITENKEIKFVEGGGIDINWTDTDNGTDGDPYDLTFTVQTLNQNTTGSAATLTTARTIGGVSFNGSANIDLPGVNSAGNQNTSGSAATLTTARNIGGVSFNGSANIDLPGVNSGGNQDTSGNAATATKIASITNSNIVQLTATQTLTNKTIAASQVTEISNITAAEGAQLENIGTTTISATQWGYLGAASGAITNTDVSVSAANLKTTLGGTFGSSALAIGTSAETVTVKGDFVVDGSITLKGDTVLESTTNTAIKDKILLLNQGASGANTNDLGILWSRGSGTTNGEANVALKWDEGDAEFHLICTTATGAEANGAIEPTGEGDSAGATGFQNLQLAKLTTTSIVLDGNTISGIDDSGEFTDNDAHIMTSAGIADRFAQINANTTGSSGSCTGLAATATALATARTIGGVSFDGTANINLPGVNSAGNQNTTGSAATLTTARTIGGVSFNGSANINLPGVNSAGNQNTSGSAATLTTARTINGVSFNGSANITVTAAAGTLSGSTLKSSVTASSLTSVGTLSSGNATAIVTAASTSAAGKVELATTAEALAGTDSARAVTPAGLAARSFKDTIGDGSATSIVVNHALGTRDVVVQMYDASSYETVYAQVVRTDTANVTVDFNTAPASNDIIVLVTKID
ncbi:hypothetical protein OAV33_00890 [bacterium]|nr:hypothetical protein [bacterium]